MPAAQTDGPSDPEAVARAVCLRLLTTQARTRSELADALRRRGVPDEAAARVLDRLAAVGLVDDGSYAEHWVRSRHEVRGLGRRALAAELRRKGVAGETVEDALAGIDRSAEHRRARELVERRLRSMPGAGGGGDQGGQKAAQRLVSLLARKGYPAGLAYEVVQEALAARGAGLPAEIDPVELDDG